MRKKRRKSSPLWEHSVSSSEIWSSIKASNNIFILLWCLTLKNRPSRIHLSASETSLYYFPTCKTLAARALKSTFNPPPHPHETLLWRWSGVWSIEGICAVLLDEEAPAQCNAVSDLPILNSDPDLHTHKFTGRSSQRVSAESRAHTLSTPRSLKTHIYQSPDELLKAHHPLHVCYMLLELAPAPGYKEHVALGFEGRVCSKFDVLLLLWIRFSVCRFPHFNHSCFPLALCSHSAEPLNPHNPPQPPQPPTHPVQQFSHKQRIVFTLVHFCVCVCVCVPNSPRYGCKYIFEQDSLKLTLIRKLFPIMSHMISGVKSENYIIHIFTKSFFGLDLI